MRVVATGVHDTRRLRSVLDVVFFENRQGIHVGTQENGFPLAAPADEAGHASLRNAGAHILETKRAQPVGHDAGRADLLKRQFRVLVKIAPIRHYTGHDLVDFVAQRRRLNHLSHLIVLL